MPEHFEISSIANWTVFVGEEVVVGGGGFDLSIINPDNGDKYKLVFVGGGGGVGAGFNFGEELMGRLASGIISANRSVVGNLGVSHEFTNPWIHRTGQDDLTLDDITRVVVVVDGGGEAGIQLELSWLVFMHGGWPAISGLDFAVGPGFIGAKLVAGVYYLASFHQLN